MKIYTYQLLCIFLASIIIAIGFQINETLSHYHTPTMFAIDFVFILFLIVVAFIAFIFIVGTYIDRNTL